MSKSLVPGRRNKPAVVWIATALAVIAALAFLNVALWLVTGLWAISAASQIGIYGFLAAIVVAIGTGVIVWRRLQAQLVVKIEASEHSAQTESRFREELAASTSTISNEERERLQRPVAKTPVILKARIKTLLDEAEASGRPDDLDAAESLLQELINLEPASEGWARAVRWEIEQLRKRL